MYINIGSFWFRIFCRKQMPKKNLAAVIIFHWIVFYTTFSKPKSQQSKAFFSFSPTNKYSSFFCGLTNEPWPASLARLHQCSGCFLLIPSHPSENTCLIYIKTESQHGGYRECSLLKVIQGQTKRQEIYVSSIAHHNSNSIINSILIKGCDVIENAF